MYKRVLSLMFVLACLCGCEAPDPYARRSDLVEQAKQTAHVRLAMTTLDRTVDVAIEELRSTIVQNEESIAALESRFDASATQNAALLSELKELKSDLELSARRDSDSVKQNAQSISSLDSRLDTLATEHAESISELTSNLKVVARRSSDTIGKNTESISKLQSALDNFSKRNTQSIVDLRAGLEQLQKDVSQLRRDVRRLLSEQEVVRAKAADQSSEAVDESGDGLQKTSIPQAEQQEDEGASSTGEKPSEGAPVESEGSSQADYNVPLSQGEEEPAFWQRRSYQLLFAAIGLIAVLSGPLVAELYAKKQRRLAAEAPSVIPTESTEEDH